MNSVVKVGIIGIGNMGSAHFNCIYNSEIDGLKVTSVCDIDIQKLKKVKESYTDIETFSNYKEFMLKSDTDAVIIAVPHPLHAEIAVAAFKAGKHVLLEKPIDIAVSKAEALCREAKKSKKIFAIMFNQRTNGLFAEARRIVRSGELGELKRSVWIITNWYRTQNYYDSGAWRATWKGEGGGVLLNQCPHQLDLWQWICGMPKKVLSKLHYGLWHDIEVEDDVTTYVEYENGATGVFITSTGDAHGVNRFEIQMDKGRLIAENEKLELLEYDMTEQEFSKTNTEPFATVGAKKIEVETDGENPQHVGVLNAWGGAILRGEPLVAGGEEGINGLTLSNAMHLSSWLDKEITLPFDEELYYNELMKRVATSKRKTNVKEVVADTSGSYSGAK